MSITSFLNIEFRLDLSAKSATNLTFLSSQLSFQDHFFDSLWVILCIIKYMLKQSMKPLSFKSPGNLWVEGNMWNKLCTAFFSASGRGSQGKREFMRPHCLFLVFCLLLFCPVFYIKTLRCSSHIIEFTLLRCTIERFLEYSQNCVTLTITNFRAFSLHPKESLTVLISSHSVFPVLHLLPALGNHCFTWYL